jgi:hypothetical protein
LYVENLSRASITSAITSERSKRSTLRLDAFLRSYNLVVIRSAMPPVTVPSTSATHSASRSSRIAPHSHIRGLGLRPDGTADAEAAGFVGQTAAREVNLPTLLNNKTIS